MITPDNLIWVILGAAAVCFLLVAGIIYIVMVFTKRTPPYRMAVDYLVSSAEVQTLLGPPLKPGWWISGKSVSVFGGEGFVSYMFEIRGSVDKATVSMMARKEANVWTVYKLSLRFEPSGKKLYLIG